MFKILKFTLASAIVSVIAFAAPTALALGQIEGGNIYWAKNVTKNGNFVDPTSADSGDTLMYRVRIHNPGEDCLANVRLKAILPSGASLTNTSTITVWADNATTNYVSDTATVNLSSAQSISYIPGTTQLLNNTSVVSTLPDTLFSTGVNINSVCVSTGNERFVQFQAKISKPTPPKPPVTPPTTPKEVTKVTSLPNTGPGDVVALFAGVSAAGAAGHYLVSRRRRN